MYTRLTTEGRIVGSAIGKFIYWALLILLAIGGIAIARVKVDQFFAASPLKPIPTPGPGQVPAAMAVAPQQVAVQAEPTPPSYVSPGGVFETQPAPSPPPYIRPTGSTVVEHRRFRWPWQKKHEKNDDTQESHPQKEAPKGKPVLKPDPKCSSKPLPPPKSKPAGDAKAPPKPSRPVKAPPSRSTPPKKGNPPTQSGSHKRK